MSISRFPVALGETLGNGRFAKFVNKYLLNNISRVGTLATLGTRVPARFINKYLIKGKLRGNNPPYDKELFDKRNALWWETFKDPSKDPIDPIK